MFNMWFLTISELILVIGTATARQFDAIIVGGGTSGLLIAEKLSENPSVSVAVLEAGLFSEQTKTLVPEIFSSFIGDPELDWGFATVPQQHSDGIIVQLPRGKALGGTSAVNGMYFVRATKKEYDAWETLGNPGWNFTSVETRIKSIENFTPASPGDAATFHAIDSLDNHGTKGPINVTYSNYWEPTQLIPAYFDTLNTLNIPTNDHAGGGETFGVWQAPCAITAANRTRSYVTNAFYTPNKSRPNLVVITGAEVTKIVLGENETDDGGVRAVGVQYITGNTSSILSVTSRGQVVVTAGTYQTPKLLELSGIGNATLLESLDIPVVIDLPGVGENLQDHPGILTTYELKPGVSPTLDQLRFNATFKNEQWMSYLANRTGAFASVPGTTLAMLPYQSFIDPTKLAAMKASLDETLQQFDGTPLEEQMKVQRAFLEDASIPQVELVMLPELQDPLVTPALNKSYMTLAAVHLRPFARGTVHINTTDPTAHAIIDPNYLGITEFETGILVEITKFLINQVAQTQPLKDLIQDVVNPVLGQTDDELARFVRNDLFSAWHPCGSASMLPKEQNGVVDPDLLVYGTKNIRVADASFIPLEISTHTMATIYANAVKAAEIIASSLFHSCF